MWGHPPPLPRGQSIREWPSGCLQPTIPNLWCTDPLRPGDHRRLCKTSRGPLRNPTILHRGTALGPPLCTADRELTSGLPSTSFLPGAGPLTDAT